VDDSDGLNVLEFTGYISRMSKWMRSELEGLSDAYEVFSLLATRAHSTLCCPPTRVPPPAEPGQKTLVDTGVLGIRLEVPSGALRADELLSVRTVAPCEVSSLSEAVNGVAHRAEITFSPVVRIDCDVDAKPPAASASHRDEHGPGATQRAFAKPLTLILPHCFEPSQGEQECVMLGAPHGEAKWQLVGRTFARTTGDARGSAQNPAELRVSVPFAGTFAAFTHPETLELDIACRLLIFTKPKLRRDDDSALRVHLCPELPDQAQQMEFAESSTWGASVCVGASHVLHLCRGARLRLVYLDQVPDVDRTSPSLPPHNTASLTSPGPRSCSDRRRRSRGRAYASRPPSPSPPSATGARSGWVSTARTSRSTTRRAPSPPPKTTRSTRSCAAPSQSKSSRGSARAPRACAPSRVAQASQSPAAPSPLLRTCKPLPARSHRASRCANARHTTLCSRGMRRKPPPYNHTGNPPPSISSTPSLVTAAAMRPPA
jgi:hypothetical protein